MSLSRYRISARVRLRHESQSGLHTLILGSDANPAPRRGVRVAVVARAASRAVLSTHRCGAGGAGDPAWAACPRDRTSLGVAAGARGAAPPPSAAQLETGQDRSGGGRTPHRERLRGADATRAFVCYNYIFFRVYRNVWRLFCVLDSLRRFPDDRVHRSWTSTWTGPVPSWVPSPRPTTAPSAFVAKALRRRGTPYYTIHDTHAPPPCTEHAEDGHAARSSVQRSSVQRAPHSTGPVWHRTVRSAVSLRRDARSASSGLRGSSAPCAHANHAHARGTQSPSRTSSVLSSCSFGRLPRRFPRGLRLCILCLRT